MDIYLSYSQQDYTYVNEIITTLERASHTLVKSNIGIPGGSHWSKSIGQVIAEAEMFIFVSSRHNRYTNWRLAEVTEAVKQSKPILVILLDKHPTYRSLSGYPMIDAAQDFDAALTTLLSQVESLPQSVPPPSAAIEEENKNIIEKVAKLERIFIAYSRHQKAWAKELADFLKQQGKAVFYDAHIKAGAQWRKIIQTALDDATHIIVIWTLEASESDEVEREVSYGLAEGKTIIPILSKEIPKLPYHLHGLHYIVMEENLAEIQTPILQAIHFGKEKDDSIWF